MFLPHISTRDDLGHLERDARCLALGLGIADAIHSRCKPADVFTRACRGVVFCRAMTLLNDLIFAGDNTDGFPVKLLWSSRQRHAPPQLVEEVLEEHHFVFLFGRLPGFDGR